MKIIIYITSSMIIFGQDSLYWFNFNSIKNTIPKTSKVLDKIFEESQFPILDSINNEIKTISEGYRLQIHEDILVDNINKSIEKYRERLPDSLYIIFEAPFYKIRYGNYITKKAAEIEKNKLINKGFKNIWIVKSRIN